MKISDISISEFALEQLILFQKKSPAHAEMVEEALKSLCKDDPEFDIIKLKGLHRPIWSIDIDDKKYILYYIIGYRSKSEEIRIIYFGPLLENNQQALRRLYILSGEASYLSLSDDVLIEDKQTTKKRPYAPERILGASVTLKDFLNPSEEEVLAAIDATPTISDDLNGQPYRIFTDIKSAKDLPIRLSPQQERILDAPLPLLLQGVAGSGKTSILACFAHRQLLKSENRASILILAYTNQLRDFILFLLNTLQTIDPVDLSRITVLTWREVCDQLGKEAGIKAFNWAPESYFLDFLNMHFKKNKNKQEEVNISDDIQEYIRGAMKGSMLDPDEEMPDRLTFLEIPHIPLDGKISRIELFDLAQQYQFSLSSKNMVDETDAARKLLKCRSATFQRYNYVLVDESQDYTATQMLLIANLCKSHDGLFFTGDMNQVLYPSLFSWKKVRSAIWKAWSVNTSEPQNIDYNYRNPQPVIDVANALMDMRTARFEIESALNIRSNHALTPRPIRIVAKPDEMDTLIRELASQIGSFGVIQESLEKMEIKGIQLERVFTPKMSKGLEFNVVCLINFNELYQDLAHPSKTYSYSQQLLKFNEVYVAVTRTRGQLLLIDRHKLSTGLWESHEMATLIDMAESPESLLNLVTARFKNKTREDWETDAIDFESQKAYAAAGECWERAGAPKNAALNYERAERWLKALSIYKSIEDYESSARICEKTGKTADAAAYYLKTGMLEKAAELFVKIDNPAKTAELYMLMAEKSGDRQHWEQAGKFFMQTRMFEKSAVCFNKAGQVLKAAECYEKCQQWSEAARHWELTDQIEKAAISYLKAGNNVKSAECFEKCQRWSEAGQEWERAGQFENAIVCYNKLNNYVRAAECYEKCQKWSEAAAQWKKANQIKKEADCHNKAKDFEKAATCYEECKEWTEAAIAWENAKQIEKAATCYFHSKDYKKAAESYENCQNWVKSAHAWDLAGQVEREATLLLRLHKFEEAAERYETYHNWPEAALAWQKAGLIEREARCYLKAKDFIKAAEIFEAYQNWTEAARQWEDAGQFGKAKDCYRKLHEASKMAEYFESYQKWYKAAQLWENAGQFERAAYCHIKSKEPLKAAECFEKCQNWRQAANLWKVIGKTEKAELSEVKLEEAVQDAKYYESNQKWFEAATIWENVGSMDQAAECYRKANNLLRVAKCYEKDHNWYEAARAWEEDGEFDNAVACFVKMNNAHAAENLEIFQCWYEAAQVWEKIGQLERAARCYNFAGDPVQAAECYKACKQWSEAAKLWESEGYPEKAAACYGKMGNHEKAATLFEEAFNWVAAAREWQNANDLIRAIQCYNKAGEEISEGLLAKHLATITYSPLLWIKSASDFEKAHNKAGAILCYEVAGYIYKAKGWYREAGQCFLKAGNRLETTICAVLKFFLGSKKS